MTAMPMTLRRSVALRCCLVGGLCALALQYAWKDSLLLILLGILACHAPGCRCRRGSAASMAFSTTLAGRRPPWPEQTRCEGCRRVRVATVMGLQHSRR